MMYLPRDFGHAYLTLEDHTEVYYQVTAAYAPENSHGFRWDDPTFNIEWPKVDELIVNKRDQEYPEFTP